jgi:methanogenic corrinoid protein MtbC1
LSDNELADLIEDEYSHSNEEDDNISLYVNQLLSSAFDFDETKFEKIFATCILRFGLKNTYSQVLYPTLKRLGVFWSKDAVLPAHEHFITNLIKQKILTAIDSFDPPTDKKAPWLLFLPEDEFHEMGLLMAYFLLRHEGHKVIYLGANIPISTLGDTIELVKPKNVLSFFVGKKDEDKNMEIIKELSSLNPKISFNLACQSNTSNLPSKKNINLVFSITDFETILD